MFDIGYFTAFAGGVLALLSPCSALLLPSFFAYAVASRTGLVARTGLFALGLMITLVPLGAGAGALASLINEHRALLVAITGWVLIALGVVQILGGGWALGPAARMQQRMASRGTALSTVGLGAAYGLAGFCSGPILGAVLTVAAAGGQAVRGAVLLAVYAVGMTVPLFVLALLWQRFDLGRRRWLRGREFSLGPLRLHTTSTVSGLLFVGVGLLFLLSDGTAGLLGADPETAAATENVLVSVGQHVPDVVLLGVAAVVVAAVAAWQLRRTRTTDDPGPDDDRRSDDDPGPDDDAPRAPEPSRSASGDPG